jgi:16S rRNA (guanine527-N7)-methyltransferase
VTEDEAQGWLRSSFDVSRETWEKLEAFVAFLRRESMSQNLVAASTLDHIWARHVVDSAQLIKMIPEGRQLEHWLDLGSGSGFPGIVAAILTKDRFTLVESRARRIDYLHRAVALLELESRVTVAGKALERMETAPFSVISARAFAPLPKLLTVAARFSTVNSLWLLPKGRNAVTELSEAESHWNLDFEVKSSLTDDAAGILVGHLLGKAASEWRGNTGKKWEKSAKWAGKGKNL